MNLFESLTEPGRDKKLFRALIDETFQMQITSNIVSLLAKIFIYSQIKIYKAGETIS